MVKLNRIYTRTGDNGDTSLADGTRAAKHSHRIQAIGAVDEANAAIGLVRLHTTGKSDAMLTRIQNDLFDLGADIATPEDPDPPPGKPQLRILGSQVDRLEQEIDAMNESLTPLNSFILPGGSPASANLHLARTIVRRAERSVAKLMVEEDVNKNVLKYLNRLSDHLFVLARFLNNKGKADVLWVPGENRAK